MSQNNRHSTNRFRWQIAMKAANLGLGVLPGICPRRMWGEVVFQTQTNSLHHILSIPKRKAPKCFHMNDGSHVRRIFDTNYKKVTCSIISEDTCWTAFPRCRWNWKLVLWPKRYAPHFLRSVPPPTPRPASRRPDRTPVALLAQRGPGARCCAPLLVGCPGIDKSRTSCGQDGAGRGQAGRGRAEGNRIVAQPCAQRTIVACDTRIPKTTVPKHENRKCKVNRMGDDERLTTG